MRTKALVTGLVSLLISPSIFSIDTGGPVQSCSAKPAVAAIVETYLPAFTLPGPGLTTADPCDQLASADFNGDGTADFAAVLTEKVAPRRWSDGTGRFTSYVFVFLTVKLPLYADHEAVLLLGHGTAPRRISLQTVRSSSGTSDRLIVHNGSYSTTIYEWRPTGFLVLKREAD